MAEAENLSAQISCRVSPPVSNAQLDLLFAASWPTHDTTDFAPILARSLAYVCAFAGDRLIGYVNLAWDGGIHAFLLDTTVLPGWRRQGIGCQMVVHAIAVARIRGMHWVHVDYAPHLDAFYRSCGCEPTLAGLVRLAE